MDGMADISKILEIIMENPEIIEKIKNLAGTGEKEETQTEREAPTEEVTAAPQDEPSENKAEEVVAEVSASPKISMKKRRHDLLCAIKPYVSKERGKAIDTMLSVIEVFDIMKAR